MSQKLNIPIDFATAHCAGQKNQQLAQEFGVSLATVKRWKQTLLLGNNDPRNDLGKLGERLLMAELARQGHHVQPMPEGHPFDLRVNGLRLEVKTSATHQEGAYRFRLNESRSSNHAQYRYGKDYQRDADVLALVIVEAGQLQHLYLLPVNLWKSSIRVRPDSPFCPYAAYRGAVHLLRQVVAA